MDNSAPAPTPEASLRSPPTPNEIGKVLRESAIQAAVSAIVVLVIGSVALQLVSALAQDMIPSTPPIYAEKSSATPALVQKSWSFLKGHGFLLVFSVLFAAGTTRGLRGLYGYKSGRLDSVLRAGYRLSDHWFELFVGNAFGAFVSAMGIYFAGQFTFGRIIGQFLMGVIQPALERLAAAIVGGSGVESCQAWLAWYGENQIRFLFWFLYVAAIGDDLGLPNFKTLARLAWRRFCPTRPPIPPVDPGSVEATKGN